MVFDRVKPRYMPIVSSILYVLGFVLNYCAIDCAELSELSKVSEVVLASFITFSSVWFAGYYIQQQTLSNRYPEELFKDAYRPIATSIIVDIFIVFVCGEISLLLSGLWGKVALIASSTISIGYMLYISYGIGKSIDTTSYVKNFTDRIIDQKKSSGHGEKKSYKILNDIFSESLARKEYYVCICVHQELSRLAQAHHKISPKLLMDNNESSINVDNEFRNIIYAMRSQIIEMRDTDSPRFVNHIFECHRDNILDCVKLDHFSLFQFYIQELIFLTYALSPSDQRRIRRHCLNVLVFCIIECDKLNRAAYWEYCITKVYEAAIGSHILAESSMTAEWIAMHAVIFCDSQVLSDGLMKSVYESFLKISLYEAQIRGEMNELIKYHMVFFKKILEMDKLELKEEYLTFIDDSFRYVRKDPSWVNCIYMFMRQLEEADGRQLREKIDGLRVFVSCGVIEGGNKNIPIDVPDYKSRLNGSLQDEEIVEAAIDSYRDLMFESIRDGEHGAVKLLCGEVAELLETLKPEQRKLQSQLFQLFLDCLTCAEYSKQRICYELILDSLEKSIRSLDAAQLLSEGLCQDVLKELFHLCEGLGIDGADKYVSRIVELLSSLYSDGRELAIMLRKNNLYIYYFDKWVTAGINALEFGSEETLRQVSNVMGWQIVRALRKNDVTTAKRLLAGAEQLFCFAKGFEITVSTELFLLTLFTVVGTFCGTSVSYYQIRQEIANFLSRENYHTIELATNIRFQPGDSWAELFNDDPSRYAQKFLEVVRGVMK